MFATTAVAASSLHIWALPAAAEVMSIEGRAVTIDPIPGYCALDKTRMDERLAFSFVEEKIAADSQLLAYWIECPALEAIRNDTAGGVGPYILVMAVKKGDRIFRTGITRQEIVERSRAEIAAVYGDEEFPANLDSQAREQLNSTIKAFAAAAKEDGPAGASKFLGFMGRDREGLYYATAQQNALNKQAPVLAGVTALTKVKQFVVTAVAYDHYVDGQTFLSLKDRGQTAVQSLIAANPFDE